MGGCDALRGHAVLHGLAGVPALPRFRHCPGSGSAGVEAWRVEPTPACKTNRGEACPEERGACRPKVR
ncbi:Hypothetical protein CAP_4413 [Chondromyces apiculatus DSM 436]|uniref:Uncharacterized protein n=1 Tax=Chondromyces apiculatus DSM 436 TaxID=1192034 RepID=A0A017T6M9_9BACT|nr:Hypothetical protein CAP_4413 [Chondromyces apiculatus DSM 436]